MRETVTIQVLYEIYRDNLKLNEDFYHDAGGPMRESDRKSILEFTSARTRKGKFT